jgi:hypothetical protein
VIRVAMTIPLRIESVANLREHWAAKAKRTSGHRLTTWAELKRHERPIGQITVKLTRIAPRPLDDDNLRSAFKACRDGVADWLGCDDRDPRVRWEYGQVRGAPKTYAARIEVSA